MAAGIPTHPPIIVDLATSAVAREKIAIKAQVGSELEPGWAFTKNGAYDRCKRSSCWDVGGTWRSKGLCLGRTRLISYRRIDRPSDCEECSRHVCERAIRYASTDRTFFYFN